MKAETLLKQFLTLSVATTTLQFAQPLATLATTHEANVSLTTRENAKAPYRNVMYYGDWSVWGGQGNQYPKDLPAGDYTHLNFAFMDFDSNGNLKLTDSGASFDNPVGTQHTWNDPLSGAIPALIALKAKNPNMKLGVSLGGWSKSGDFSTVSKSAEKRAKFVHNVLKFIKLTDFDFVDIDWEYPTSVREADLVDNKNDEGTPNATPEDKDNYILLMQDLKNGLNAQGAELGKTYELSTALPGSIEKMDAGIDVERLFNIIDFGNIMTYDLNGAWADESGHQTGLYTNPAAPNDYSVDTIVQYLKNKNVEMDKVVIGAAFYTRGWNTVEEGDNPELPGLFQHASATNKDADQTPSYGASNDTPGGVGDGGRCGGVWAHRNIDTLKSNDSTLKEYWDDIAKAPYLYSKTTKHFYTFDNIRSINEKTNYVKANHLGGVISWMASQDKDYKNNGVRSELTDTIAKGLYGENFALPSQKQSYQSDLNIHASIAVSNTDSGKKGFEISISNRESSDTSGGDAISYADRYHSSVKRPRLVFTLKDNSTLDQGDYRAGKVYTQGNKTYVKLSEQYDGRYIQRGETKSFKLIRADGKEASADDIASIELVQYYDEDLILSNQVIYDAVSNVSDVQTTNVVENNAKYSLGLKDVK